MFYNLYAVTQPPPDIIAYSPDDKLQLVVEVKNKKGSTVDWATQMRQNLLDHLVVPNSPYFLLALPDYFYLWKNNGSTNSLRPPDYTGSSRPILDLYLNDSHYLDTMSEYGLELIIKSWLSRLIDSELTRQTARPFEIWLLDSGLYDAIKNGYVKTAATV